MYKRNKNNKKIILLVILLFLLGISFYGSTLKGDRKLNGVEGFFKDIFTSVEKVMLIPFKYVYNKYEDYLELVKIREKYQLVIDDISRVESLNAENMELRRQLGKLKEELEIKNTLNDYAYLNATVIYRDVTSWYNEITIDKGSANGVEVDMAVVSAKGLIGKVIDTTKYTSTIRLITANTTNNKISITINNGKNSVTGLISKYNRDKGVLEVEGVSNTSYVNDKAYVYTSGLGGVFPSGILIGTVKNIKTDEYGLAKLIDVEMAIDIDDINYVAVLKRKELSP